MLNPKFESSKPSNDVSNFRPLADLVSKTLGVPMDAFDLEEIAKIKSDNWLKSNNSILSFESDSGKLTVRTLEGMSYGFFIVLDYESFADDAKSFGHKRRLYDLPVNGLPTIIETVFGEFIEMFYDPNKRYGKPLA
ncbi:hypothetical protein HYU09_04410 [Candidatus Woesearchaeota archaeon]|nr:hypothetical protein [Candidatus Woesearchaeota archaeon]